MEHIIFMVMVMCATILSLKEGKMSDLMSFNFSFNLCLNSQFDRFIPISKLKYYFAVDTIYVGKKLGLLVFPYMHEV